MKLQLLIIIVLKYLVLANQGELDKEEQGFDVDGLDLESLFNGTTPDYDEEAFSPCSETLPGFNSVGITITYIIVFIFSMFGNSVVVYVVCYMQKTRASTDIYLMHLALADLLFTLTLPFWAVDAYTGWVFGTFLCKLLSAFQEASVYSGVFLLACISVDRHFAIVRPTRPKSSFHTLVKMVCGVVWMVAGMLSLPVAIQRQSLYDKGFNQYICYENLTGESSDMWRVSIRIVRHTVGFFLPLVVMAFCYGWTIITLFHTRNQQKHKAMRVILAVVLAFVICWLPYNVTILIDTLIKGETLKLVTCETRYRVVAVLNVTQVLAFLHCAVNPVLYAFIGQKFRDELLSSLYRHGLVGRSIYLTYRTGSVNSAGSVKSRNTSATM
ncbi:C-X-C chemokine receptor type 1 [Cheilinus undulatus]|uniref:C-X-C chemokine receptor type 1 n=1 Tax=Cheilinus undulatus TaxID=241271 RepID=UPI001BD30D5D|nr:C-X-C chemokine receptor type 1 [Cheilinus undulatus]